MSSLGPHSEEMLGNFVEPILRAIDQQAQTFNEFVEIFAVDIRADLAEGNLSDMDMAKALLAEADLHNARLDGAKMQQANLQHANLTNSNLFGADLQEANLSEADLSNVDLREANLQDVDLVTTNVTNALFCHNQGLSSETKEMLQRKQADVLEWNLPSAVTLKTLLARLQQQPEGSKVWRKNTYLILSTIQKLPHLRRSYQVAPEHLREDYEHSFLNRLFSIVKHTQSIEEEEDAAYLTSLLAWLHFNLEIYPPTSPVADASPVVPSPTSFEELDTLIAQVQSSATSSEMSSYD